WTCPSFESCPPVKRPRHCLSFYDKIYSFSNLDTFESENCFVREDKKRRSTMVCGGFVCTKNSLCALNILYVMVSLLLIGVAAWGKWFGLVSSFRVVAGVIGVGIFLLFVAFVGLCGALKHHQVLLFFYMIILFLVFMVQLSVSAACLAINKEQQNELLEVGWNKSEATQKDVEKTLNCCGFSHPKL
ncbi:hypothetical protein J4Q44_G00018500, partial [Coregonus suidteri]